MPEDSNQQPDNSPKPMKIYTMPEKFFIEEKGGGGGGNRFLLIIVIVVAVILLGVGAFIFIQKQSEPVNNDSLNISNQPINALTNNANRNSNNSNKNTNVANTNLNVNRNANATININLFGNANTNGNTNALANVNTVVPASRDSDSDGLTDTEEAIYGTSISIPDTDGDGYVDGQEVVSSYDPLSRGQLQASAAVRSYVDSTEGYNILYPSSWALSDDPQNTRGKMFTTEGEFMEVSVQENPAKLSARDWYLAKSPGIDSSKVVTVTNWNKTLTGVKSLDGLSVYFTKGDKAYLINYNISILTEANYKSTFQMMFSSFVLGAVATNTNTVTNTNAANTNTSSNQNTHSNNSNSNTNVNTNTAVNTNSNTNNTNHF